MRCLSWRYLRAGELSAIVHKILGCLIKEEEMKRAEFER